MRKIFLLIAFSSTLLFGQQDSNSVNTDSVVQESKKVSNTIDVAILKTPTQNFGERNEGTIIGSLLAGLIAIFNVRYTIIIISRKLTNKIKKYTMVYLLY